MNSKHLAFIGLIALAIGLGVSLLVRHDKAKKAEQKASKEIDELSTKVIQTATKLAEQGRPLMIVVTPVHPDWKVQYDADHEFLTSFTEEMKAALDGTGARLWNADAANVVDESAFVDAIHIRWSAATAFTSAIVEKLHAD